VWHWLVIERLGWRRPSPVTAVDVMLRAEFERRLARLELNHEQLAARLEVIERMEEQKGKS
jgi:hypothetical protein